MSYAPTIQVTIPLGSKITIQIPSSQQQGTQTLTQNPNKSCGQYHFNLCDGMCIQHAIIYTNYVERTTRQFIHLHPTSDKQQHDLCANSQYPYNLTERGNWLDTQVRGLTAALHKKYGAQKCRKNAYKSFYPPNYSEHQQQYTN